MSENTKLKDFLGLKLYPRTERPRMRGLTSVAEHSEPLPVMEGMLEAYGDYIDIVKVMISRLYEPVDCVRKMIDLLHRYKVAIQPAGPFVEIARLQNRGREVLANLRDLGFTHVEVSCSTIDTREIEEDTAFARLALDYGLQVVGEVGKKWPEGDKTRVSEDVINVEETIKQMKAYLDAGVDKFYWEGMILRRVIGQTPEDVARKRESAVAQIMPVVEAIGQDHIVFETTSQLPGGARRLMYLWFIRHFGPEVNLANCHFSDVRNIENMRHGIAPVIGLGRAGDHPWIRSIAKGNKPDADGWWQE